MKTTLNKWLLAVGFITALNTGFSQNAPGNASPNGIFEKVYDRFGTQYDLKDLAVSTVKSQTLCASSGYFNLYFENGSGFELNTATHINRRNVMCQLFNDLSAFIVPANPLQKVNIWVRDINQVVPGSGSSNVLGLATSFYTMPSGAPTVTGIADGEIWKTIHAGQDSYINVASPLYVVGGQSTGFYHGLVAFNFNSPAINWHTALSAVTTNTLYDLYSVGLHEIVHALGFASLIDFNGLSKLSSAGFNYYSRYDMFLKTAANQNLIVNTGSSCSLYGFGFNTALNATSILAPGGGGCVTDNTSCSTAIKFAGSVNQPVYTPNCFEPPSSLSHLEDQCHLPTNYANNAYYTMSNANGMGPVYMKRYLKEEERKVLCDLGYNVATTYGNNLNPANNTTYTGGVCPGLNIGGINDGINNGFFSYEITVGQTAALTGIDILGNDHNATSFECLEDIYNNGTLNVTSGNNLTTILYTGTAQGTALLRYIPVNSAGHRGNITYVFIRVNSGNCIADPCNMISNGEFEMVVGNCANVLNQEINCWSTFASSPELLGRNCPNNNIPTNKSNPASDTWNNGANNNDHFLGLYGRHYQGYSDNEAVQTLLTSPLVQGATYTLRFKAKVANYSFFVNIPANIAVCGSPGSMASQYSYDINDPAITQLIPSIVIPADNSWHSIMQTFTYNGSTPLNNFIMGYYADPTDTQQPRFVYIDRVELSPAGTLPVFEPLSPLCENDVLNNLQQYASPTGGTFSGPYVTESSGIYSFTAYAPGTYEVFYNYTNNFGCEISIPAEIVVVPKYTPTLNITASSTVACVDSPVTLTVTGGSTYTWSPLVICDPTCGQVTVTPLANTIYTVTGGTGLGCSATQTILISIGQSACCMPAAFIIPNNATSGSYPSLNNAIVDITGNFIINTSAVYVNVTFRMAPGAKITVNNTAALTLNNCKIFACTNMWDGIYLLQLGGSAGTFISMNGTSIEDAIEGVVANSNNTTIASTIKVQNTMMNKNLKNFQISNYTGSNAYSFGFAQSTITCVSSANSPGATLKAPYASNRTYIGIQLTSVNKVTVGQAASTLGNLFNNMNYGIYAVTSDLRAINNTFTKIDGGFPFCLQLPQGPQPPCPGTGIAIFAPNHVAPTTKTLVVGGSAAFEANTFKDVLIAVDATFMGATSIVKNTFNCPVTSPSFPQGSFVGLTGNAGVILEDISGTINVSQNTITNFATAISYRRNSSTFNYNPAASVLSNVITSNASGYVSTGITVFDQSGNTIVTPATLVVKDNTLSNITSQGIKLANIKNSPVVSGSSYLSQSVNMLYAASGTKYGIFIQSCAKTSVINNNVLSSNKGNANMHGIYVQTSLNSLVKCNSISNIAMALTIHGDCTGPYTSATSYAYGIINNKFTNTAAGLNFRTSGKVGQQGDATHPSANNWATTPANSYNLGQTKVDGSSLPANSIFYCSSGVNTTPTSNLPIGTGYVVGSTILAASGHVVSCGGIIILDPPKKDLEAGRPAVAEITSGLEDGESAMALLTVYPNPNNGLFYIQADKELSHVTIRITDLLGKEIVNTSFDKLNSEAIDFSFADKGLYNVEVLSKGTLKYFKLVKQ